MMERIIKSGLIEVARIPNATPCPKLVIACMNTYDSSNRLIRTCNGELLVKINRETILAAIGIPHED